jgi:2,4-dienoyl-CoA reductase-like NADH-dependent reductase (Old Yellow Enzyme family)
MLYTDNDLPKKGGYPLATKSLFEPVKLGTLTLPNRIVMAPMTRSYSPNGVPGDDVVAYCM